MAAGATTNDTASVPLIVTNTCGETIWPGIGTQHGAGPGTGGFELLAGDSVALRVGLGLAGPRVGAHELLLQRRRHRAPASSTASTAMAPPV